MENITLEERVARLEGALGWVTRSQPLPKPMALLGLGLGGAAVYLSSRGLGIPNHPYQVVLGAVAILLAYHRHWILRPVGGLQWALGALNMVQAAFLMKLFIGSGQRMPLGWIQVPSLAGEAGEGSWWQVLPKWSLNWSQPPLAAWVVDLTVVQTFLLVITLVGALFRFQPFVSLTALLLIIVSIPAFSEFNWTWVFPAIVTTGVSLYIQSQGPRPTLP